MATTVHLTGYVGAEPEHRLTRPRTLTRSFPRHDDCVFVHVGRWTTDPEPAEAFEDEITSTPRGYTVFSVATHLGRGRHRKTFWHRIVAWGTDRHHGVLRWVHKGDQVAITARPDTYVTEDGRELVQLVLVDCRILWAKPRDPGSHPRFGQLTQQLAG